MKTRRDAFSAGCSALSFARAAATSGRSCSAACRTFFERDLVAVEEAPDRAYGNGELLLATQAVADFLERQIGLFGDEVEQPLRMRLERRAAVPGAGLGLGPCPLSPSDRASARSWTVRGRARSPPRAGCLPPRPSQPRARASPSSSPSPSLASAATDGADRI